MESDYTLYIGDKGFSCRGTAIYDWEEGYLSVHIPGINKQGVEVRMRQETPEEVAKELSEEFNTVVIVGKSDVIGAAGVMAIAAFGKLYREDKEESPNDPA